MFDMSSHLPSSISPPYANTSFGYEGMMPPSYPSPFGGSHILQTTLTIAGWNLPSYKSIMREVSAQLSNTSMCYTPSTYPSSTMSVPTNTFHMEDLCLPSGVSFRGNYFNSMGNPPHKFPSSRGNIYPHMSNPCHVAFSSQETSSLSMPLQPFMSQYGGGYYPTEQGQGVNQGPSWHTISQNQSFHAPWTQMPQFTTTASPVTTCHTSIILPTTTSHVGYWSTTSTSHVEDLQPTAASHDGGTSLVTACHTGIISQTSTSHVGDWSTTFAIHVEDLQPAATSHDGGICLVTTSHTTHPSLTSASHVGDSSPTSASHVGDSSPTSASHVGDFLLASASHAGSMLPANPSHAGDIHMIEKPRCLKRKPRFLCRTCEGSHLTHLCPITTRIP
jgi:hypothetical protein